MSEEQYMEPVHPWALNASELDRLRGRLRAAEAEAAKETDWVQRTRAEQNAKVLERELRSAEFATKQVLQQRRVGQQAGGQPSPGFVASDCGTAYVFVANTEKGKGASRAVAAAAAGTQQQYAEPDPYFQTM